MKIKTSKQIKFISLELRKIHESKPTSESKDKFNKFQYTKWIQLEKLENKLSTEIKDAWISYDTYNDEQIKGFALGLEEVLKIIKSFA